MLQAKVEPEPSSNIMNPLFKGSITPTRAMEETHLVSLFKLIVLEVAVGIKQFRQVAHAELPLMIELVETAGRDSKLQPLKSGCKFDSQVSAFNVTVDAIKDTPFSAD